MAIIFLTTILLICAATSYLLLEDLKTRDNKMGDTVDELQREFVPIKPIFISNHRAFINAATAICILAVDFPVFPRRFCKTETFGTGLMDAGVGSFIVSNAIVSKEARKKSARSSLNNLRRMIWSTWPLVLLGYGRLASLKSVDYHEHVTEYGVHWNFFFTLAFVKISSTLFYTFITPQYSLLSSIIVCLIYELVLNHYKLADYLLMDGYRETNFFDANREGIASCLGYMALYLASVQLGRFLFHPERLLKKFLKLFVLYAFLLVFLHLYQLHISEVSRRMANLPYVIWMMVYNVQLLMSFILVEIVTSNLLRKLNRKENSCNSSLLEAINSNGLFFFLLSNLMTGLINMSYDTIHSNNSVALLIIFSYMFLTCLVARLFYHFDMKVKFW